FANGLISLQLQTGVKGKEEDGVSIKLFERRQIVITRANNNNVGDILDLSLDYLPGFHMKHALAHIVSSCNGLLLCYNNRSLLRDDALFICNPLTKQWASIPPIPFPSLDQIKRLGFVCDPHYSVDDHGGVVLNPRCRFRIVRLFGASDDSDPQFDADVFSSETGTWTKRWISRTKSYKDGCNYSIIPVMNYDNKIQIQVGASIVIYDPFSDQVCGDIDPPAEATANYTSLEGFSWCQGSLWVCQLRNECSTLYVWRLIDNEQRWNLERKVVFTNYSGLIGLRFMYWSGRVLAMHPDNPNMVFLCDNRGKVLSWDLQRSTSEVVGHTSDCYYSWSKTFFFELPLWPYFISNFPSLKTFYSFKESIEMECDTMWVWS
ncbi:hypothetical protein RND81_14G006100, partial [Saponaria officinalis]